MEQLQNGEARSQNDNWRRAARHESPSSLGGTVIVTQTADSAIVGWLANE